MRRDVYVKVMLLLVLVLSLMVTACTKASTEPTPVAPTTTDTVAPAPEPAPTPTPVEPASSVPAEKTFTMKEIAKFDGQKGNPAYVVVNGVVYDVTNVAAWPKGIHQGKYKAGQDVTDLLMNTSPHGAKVLEKLPVVGKIK